MKKVIMGIGNAGAGKTTVLKPFAEKYGYTYICPDEIRQELSGDALDQSRMKEVWDIAYARVAEALAADQTVVFDSTFAKQQDRRNCIVFVRSKGAEIVEGLYIDTPLELTRERNTQRDRQVPGHALDRMHGYLQDAPPSTDDGFDAILTVDGQQDLNEIERLMADGIRPK